MTKTLTAVYENGVLRPSEPLPLDEGQAVEVTVTVTDELKRNRELVEALKRIAALPMESPDDGFTGADHDKVLYGHASGREGDAR